MPESTASDRVPNPRYYIGEWYGHDFATLSPENRSAWAARPPVDALCPFKSGLPVMTNKNCSKEGGVCSLRLYAKAVDGTVTPREKRDTVCPHRFLENGKFFEWIGEHILGDPKAAVVPEVPFLNPALKNSGATNTRAIGKIDHVLVSQKNGVFEWCAVEIQAVYFSGENMRQDVDLHSASGPGLIWPLKVRRPDYRSSGPKRLMPQLQTKVPTISRWGKKTAVVIDEAFWNSLGKMSEVADLSNAEVAWFVMKYSANAAGGSTLESHSVHHTTLDGAVVGLTGGTPMPKDRFESELRERLRLLEAKTNLDR